MDNSNLPVSTGDLSGQSPHLKTSLTTVETADRRTFARTIAHMSAAKLTGELSKPQLRTWFGILSVFPNWILNRAVLEIVTSDIRFPEVGDLYQRCREHAIKQGVMKLPEYVGHGTGSEKPRLSRDEVTSIGEALGLIVDNPARSRNAGE